MIKAAADFRYIRPDEVAECWDGVDAVPGLYAALWACVSGYKAPSPEESEEPCIGLDSVTDFWDSFSDEHKEALNRLADQHAEFWTGHYDEHQPDEAQEWADFDPDC